MEEHHLRSVIVSVRQDGDQVVRAALGESMTGVPVTADMHFRNGAVAISYMAMALLQLVDEGKVSLDDRVAQYLPELPHAADVNLRQLAQMTSGYADYEQDARFRQLVEEQPFRQWTDAQKLRFGAVKPLWFEPGTNWGYSHTNYVILGQVLSKVTGQPLAALLQDRVLGPLGLDQTSDNGGTPSVPDPVQHSFSAERRTLYQIPADVPFLEETTFWNPSWSLADGAIQTTTIDDMVDTAQAVADGTGLSDESHEAMISTDLRGFGTLQKNCPCGPQTEFYAYGLGVVTSGDWVLQNPLFAGHSQVEAALRDGSVAMAVAVTFDEQAFDKDGAIAYDAKSLFAEVAAVVAPDDPVPARPS